MEGRIPRVELGWERRARCPSLSWNQHVYIEELMARLTAITEGTVLLHDDSSSEYGKRIGSSGR
jgi:hypothetical protein